MEDTSRPKADRPRYRTLVAAGLLSSMIMTGCVQSCGGGKKDSKRTATNQEQRAREKDGKQGSSVSQSRGNPVTSVEERLAALEAEISKANGLHNDIAMRARAHINAARHLWAQVPHETVLSRKNQLETAAVVELNNAQSLLGGDPSSVLTKDTARPPVKESRL